MLVLTLGDPHSVTLELLGALLAPTGAAASLRRRFPVILVGHGASTLAPLLVGPATGQQPGLYAVEVQPEVAQPKSPAAMSEVERGAASVQALAWLKSVAPGPGERLAVVTGPIDKHACQTAGFAYPGQTEYFSALWGQPAIMILAGPRLRVGLVTNHLPLRAVAAAITPELVAHKLRMFISSLRRDFGVAVPRVAVCGLNPHAGDGGLFGDEEARCLSPAIAAVAAELGTAAQITGPVPADTAFYRGYNGTFDGVLAMYHDQGLGPLKTVHFDEAVNLSGGCRIFAPRLIMGRRAIFMDRDGLLAPVLQPRCSWQRLIWSGTAECRGGGAEGAGTDGETGGDDRGARGVRAQSAEHRCQHRPWGDHRHHRRQRLG